MRSRATGARAHSRARALAAQPVPGGARPQSNLDEALLDGSRGVKQWRALATLRSHLDAVRCLAFHPAEPALLSGSEDGTLKLWALAPLLPESRSAAAAAPKRALEPAHTFRGHTAMVTSAALTPSLLASAAADGDVFVWELPDLSVDAYARAQMPPPLCAWVRWGVLVWCGCECALSCSALARGARRYAGHGRCRKFLRARLGGHADAVWSVCAHPTEQLLFTAGADGHVGIYALDALAAEADGGVVPTVSPRATLRYSGKDGVARTPTCVAVPPTEPRQVAVGFSTGEVAVADVETGQIVRVMFSRVETANANPLVIDMAGHPTLGLLMTAHHDCAVRVFDPVQVRCVPASHGGITRFRAVRAWRCTLCACMRRARAWT